MRSLVVSRAVALTTPVASLDAGVYEQVPPSRIPAARDSLPSARTTYIIVIIHSSHSNTRMCPSDLD